MAYSQNIKFDELDKPSNLLYPQNNNISMIMQNMPLYTHVTELVTECKLLRLKMVQQLLQAALCLRHHLAGFHQLYYIVCIKSDTINPPNHYFMITASCCSNKGTLILVKEANKCTINY